MSFDVLQIHGGWFEVRLVSGQTGWLWSPFVAVSSFLFADDKEVQREGPDATSEAFAVSLTTGLNVLAQHVERAAEAAEVTISEKQRIFVDSSLVRRIDRASHGLDWDWSTRDQKIEFRDGRVIAGRAQVIDGGAVIIHVETGHRVIADASLVALEKSEGSSSR